MQYVQLGQTGLKVSRLGFGGIPIRRIDHQIQPSGAAVRIFCRNALKGDKVTDVLFCEEHDDTIRIVKIIRSADG